MRSFLEAPTVTVRGSTFEISFEFELLRGGPIDRIGVEGVREIQHAARRKAG